MTALIACLIIDNEYKDPKSIEQVMTRLQISKQWNTLRALLNYVRNENLDSLIRSFPLLWFRVYENALIELNGGSVANSSWSYEQCVMLRKWTLWVMGSNVEGGRQPNITRFLRELNCPGAASVVSVLSNWTVEVSFHSSSFCSKTLLFAENGRRRHKQVGCATRHLPRMEQRRIERIDCLENSRQLYFYPVR